MSREEIIKRNRNISKILGYQIVKEPSAIRGGQIIRKYIVDVRGFDLSADAYYGRPRTVSNLIEKL